MTQWPDLSGAKRICVDVETYDPGIAAGKGPGVRSGGFICGVAVGVDGAQWYFPVAHERGENLDPEAVKRWAQNNLNNNIPKYGANIIYDLDYLSHWGVDVGGPLVDVQILEPLLDENRFDYSLEALAQLHLGEGKESNKMYEWLAEHFGGRPTRKDQAGNIWRAPPDVVAPYAKSDVRLPLCIADKQRPLLSDGGFNDVASMELQLIPMMLAMRRRGVRVDVDAAEELRGVVQTSIDDGMAQLSAMAGRPINPKSPIDMGALLDKLGITYSMTPKSGKPSITKAYLAGLDHPVARIVEDIRKHRTILDTFIDGHILGSQLGGRIHCEFHQMRRGADGTRSGRFSSASPNLQNIPARDPVLTPLIRGLFLPEEGEEWYSDDWSQIEYRWLAHYAIGPGSEAVRRKYKEDPETDFHAMAADIVLAKTGKTLGRKPTKNLNFGLVYGMGLAETAMSMNISLETARELQSAYFEACPFVKATFDRAAQLAGARGWIRTIMGRKRRFPQWEARRWADRDACGISHSRDEMLRRVAQIGSAGVQRAGTHKALNSVLQGSAADAMKKAMVDIWEAGVCDVLGAPLLTVHDELCWSIPGGREAREAHDEAVRIMKTCIDISVPLMVDVERGTNWGNIK